ncbi:MAG: ATP-binding protein [Lachnospiraceae bacterium]|nr:ATP-binding protein [Lachnospiraceae bacterium]
MIDFNTPSDENLKSHNNLLHKAIKFFRFYGLIFFICLAFGLMAMLSYIFVRSIVERHLEIEAYEKLSNIELQITADFNELETMLTMVSNTIADMIDNGESPEMISYYIKALTTQIRADEQIIPSFVSINGMFDIYDGLIITGMDTFLSEDYAPAERPWFKAAEAANGEIGVTTPYISVYSGDLSITITRCIFDRNNDKIATVFIDVLLEDLQSFTNVIDSYNPNCYSVILDDSLTFISHPMTELIGLNLNEIGLEIVSEVDMGHNIFVYRGEVDNEHFVINSKQLRNGWHIGVVSDVNSYYLALYQIRFYLIILAFGLSLLVSIIVSLIVKSRQKAESAMNSAIEQKNALNHLENILNGLDAMVYVSDPETSQLLFVNTSMKKHYDLDDNYAGQPCYKLLQNNKEKPCNFCPCKKLNKNPNQVIVWEDHIKSKDHVYRHSDRYIDWPNGKKVHLQHTIDITDLKDVTNARDKQLKQQALMTSISQSFLFGEGIDTMMSNALKMVGELMDISQISLYQTEGDNVHLTCIDEWIHHNLHLPSRIGDSLSFTKAMLSLFDNQTGNVVCITSDDPGAKEVLEPYRKNANNSFMITSIFVESNIYAVLDYSRDDGQRWTYSEKDMAILFSNILAGAFQRRTANEQLITAKEIAEESNRTKSIFLANMSHEIRTPMNSILGMAEIQLQDKNLLPDVEDAFNIIYDSGNLLINIINDILDFSKIEAGKLELIPANYDLLSLINDTAQLIRLRHESKPLEFILNISEVTPLKWFGDELRIKQILNNLLSNAFKYTMKGYVELNISAETGSVDDDKILVIKVIDTGQGMSNDQIEQLYDEYMRFNTVINRYEVGTGLGMSITKRLIDLMNGEILVESEVGKGTVFTVRLPQISIGASVCGTEHIEKMKKARLYSTSKSKRAQFKREYMPYGRVLIVDDVGTNLYVAKGLLLPYGLKIETASSGFETIDLVKAGNIYDIIFMDHMMPKMDGLEATDILRNMGYDQPIIALTANVIVGQAEVFLANGFDGFLAKPIDIREMNTVLNSFIRDKQPPEVIEEARRNEAVHPADTDKSFMQIEAIKAAFVRDAESAIELLTDIFPKLNAKDKDDLRLFVTCVHGLKSVLNVINEQEVAELALSLEQSGRDENYEIILEKTPLLLERLKLLITELKPFDANDSSVTSIADEDLIFLRERLSIIKKACEGFDKKTVRKALGEVFEKEWPDYIMTELGFMEKYLLHSAFKKVLEVAEGLEV